MNTIPDRYRSNVSDAQQRIAALRKAINRNALWRLAVIVGGGTALFMAVQSEQVWLVMAVFFAVIVLFMGLVWRQSKLEAQRATLADFQAVNENELATLRGEPNSYPNGDAFVDGRHPYSGDLDIYGRNSLFEQINRGATPQANRMLADWLAEPADAATIADRQQTVRELAADTDWRLQFQTALWFNIRQREDVKAQFERFLRNGEKHFGNRYLRAYVVAVPYIMACWVVLAVFFPVFSSVALFFAMAHLLAAIGNGYKVNRVAGQVYRAGKVLHAFARSFAFVEQRAWKTDGGRALRDTLSGAGGGPISAALMDLSTLIDRLDYRLNMLVGAVLNMVALWDFRQVFAIIDWRKRHGHDVLKAFDVVAETEVLLGLAALSGNHPSWQFPEVVRAPGPVLNAEQLAHPLIPAGKAVPNDYQLENHRIALITGSNMAGKSTFLRTVGINAVLAFSGGPICGTYMRLSVFRLVAYMRIADNLNESTSTFKAELNRIQLVLKQVKEQPDTFFLIDEMLRGTNSKDKYLGSKAIIRKLIADKGVGMLATHDLQLAQLAGEYAGVLANYHFDIQVEAGEMHFDYKLKHGECTIFNASLLLKGIGIDVDDRE